PSQLEKTFLKNCGIIFFLSGTGEDMIRRELVTVSSFPYHVYLLRGILAQSILGLGTHEQHVCVPMDRNVVSESSYTREYCTFEFDYTRGYPCRVSAFLIVCIDVGKRSCPT